MVPLTGVSRVGRSIPYTQHGKTVYLTLREHRKISEAEGYFFFTCLGVGVYGILSREQGRRVTGSGS